MNRFLALITGIVISTGISGCGTTEARTNTFVSVPKVTAMLGLPDGSLRYATAGGAIFDVDKDGRGSSQPVTTVAEANEHGVLGLVADEKQRTFASWIDVNTNTLTIAQIAPGSLRVIYRGTEKAATDTGSRLAVSAENRIVVAFTPQNGTSRVLSVDPDRNDDQQANAISVNWNHLGGLAYAAGHVLWVVDNGTAANEKNGDRLSRITTDGPTGNVTNTDANENPVAMTRYGDTELVVCFAKTGTLQRFLINDGIHAIAGRVLARDCASDVVQLHDGRAAYATPTEIRVSQL